MCIRDSIWLVVAQNSAFSRAYILECISVIFSDIGFHGNHPAWKWILSPNSTTACSRIWLVAAQNSAFLRAYILECISVRFSDIGFHGNDERAWKWISFHNRTTAFSQIWLVLAQNSGFLRAYILECISVRFSDIGFHGNHKRAWKWISFPNRTTACSRIWLVVAQNSAFLRAYILECISIRLWFPWQPRASMKMDFVPE